MFRCAYVKIQIRNAPTDCYLFTVTSNRNWAKNLENWCNVGGFDNLTFRQASISSLLAKEAFLNLVHPIQPFKFGIKSFAAKMAAKFNINLVMYGESYAEMMARVRQ